MQAVVSATCTPTLVTWRGSRRWGHSGGAARSASSTRHRGRGPELVAEASAARQTVAGSAVLPLADFLLFSEA